MSLSRTRNLINQHNTYSQHFPVAVVLYLHGLDVELASLVCYEIPMAQLDSDRFKMSVLTPIHPHLDVLTLAAQAFTEPA